MLMLNVCFSLLLCLLDFRSLSVNITSQFEVIFPLNASVNNNSSTLVESSENVTNCEQYGQISLYNDQFTNYTGHVGTPTIFTVVFCEEFYENCTIEDCSWQLSCEVTNVTVTWSQAGVTLYPGTWYGNMRAGHVTVSPLQGCYQAQMSHLPQHEDLGLSRVIVTIITNNDLITLSLLHFVKPPIVFPILVSVAYFTIYWYHFLLTTIIFRFQFPSLVFSLC